MRERNMRQLLLVSLLVVGAGCHGLRDRLDCRRSICSTTEPCSAPEKKGPADIKAQPEKKGPADIKAQPQQETPAIAQDVLLVPVTSYVPYARQTPVGPLRMTMPQNITTAPRIPAEERIQPPAEEVKKLLEICEKQSERINQLERCLKDRNVCPPTIICPPTAPVCPPPLPRRPLFPRCEPLFPRCEPNRCETLVPCEPADNKRSSAPLPAPSNAQPAVLTVQ